VEGRTLSERTTAAGGQDAKVASAKAAAIVGEM